MPSVKITPCMLQLGEGANRFWHSCPCQRLDKAQLFCSLSISSVNKAQKDFRLTTSTMQDGKIGNGPLSLSATPYNAWGKSAKPFPSHPIPGMAKKRALVWHSVSSRTVPNGAQEWDMGPKRDQIGPCMAQCPPVLHAITPPYARH